MAHWTEQERENAPDHYWAVPAKKKLRIDDETHTRLAWDMVDRTHDLSDAERAAARSRILRRAKDLGIDTSEWEKGLRHEAILVLTAMSLDLPAIEDHPNRMPFKGILTRIGQPSDMPVGGSGGKRTIMAREVAESLLPSLMGMPVDYTAGFDGHDVKKKIGTITAATIEGDALLIEGFFFAADLPAECERIKQEKDRLGFSYEIKAYTQPAPGDLLQIVGGAFTGAAVLYKDKAAYQTTSLAAQAAEEIDTMTAEEFQAMLTAQLAPLAQQVTTMGNELAALKANAAAPLQANQAMRERVAPHVTALRNCAASMEAAGIGLHTEHGHVRVLHHMCANMEASAASGHLPYIFRDHDWTFRAGAELAPVAQPKLADDPAIKALTDSVASLGTKLGDLQATAFRASEPPARKTLSAEGLTLLSKAGIKPDEKTNQISIQSLDAAVEKTGMSRQQSIALKLALQGAGMLAA